MEVDGGSGCRLSYQGWRDGGNGLDVDFVLGLRRRIDACSGVDVELWSLYRSVVPVALRRQRPVCGLFCARSIPSFVVGEVGMLFSPVVLWLGASSTCWFVRTEVDDFPSAVNPSADVKVTPAPGGSGGGGAAARHQLASVDVLSRLPRDPCVIYVLCRVLCTTGNPY